MKIDREEHPNAKYECGVMGNKGITYYSNLFELLYSDIVEHVAKEGTSDTFILRLSCPPVFILRKKSANK